MGKYNICFANQQRRRGCIVYNVKGLALLIIAVISLGKNIGRSFAHIYLNYNICRPVEIFCNFQKIMANLATSL